MESCPEKSCDILALKDAILHAGGKLGLKHCYALARTYRIWYFGSAHNWEIYEFL